jgi:hypothetical protein
MKMKKFTTFFFPNSHEQYNDTCEFGLSGQRHVENDSGLDGLQALLAAGVLNVRRRIARRSRTPKMNIFKHAVAPAKRGQARPGEQKTKGNNKLLRNQSRAIKFFDKTYPPPRRINESVIASPSWSPVSNPCGRL